MELALWFQPLSAPAGVREVPGIAPARNFSVGAIGGHGGFPSYSSHGFATSKPVWETMYLYYLMKRICDGVQELP